MNGIKKIGDRLLGVIVFVLDIILSVIMLPVSLIALLIVCIKYWDKYYTKTACKTYWHGIILGCIANIILLTEGYTMAIEFVNSNT